MFMPRSPRLNCLYLAGLLLIASMSASRGKMSAGRQLKRKNGSEEEISTKGQKRELDENKAGQREDSSLPKKKILHDSNPAKASDMSSSKSSSHPLLLKVVRIKDEEYRVITIDNISVFNIDETTVILITDGSTLTRYYERNGEKVNETLGLASINSVTKINPDTAGVLCSYRRLYHVKVHPKLTVINSVNLKNDYRDLQVKNETLIVGLKIIDDFESVPVLMDQEGKVLKTFKSDLMKNITVPRLSHVCITPNNDIVALDTWMRLVFSFSQDGCQRFVFPSSAEDRVPQDRLSKLTSITCDSRSNIYLAWQRLDTNRSLVVKLNSEGQFVEKMCLGDDIEKAHLKLTLHVDNRDQFYVCSSTYRLYTGGDIMVYAL